MKRWVYILSIVTLILFIALAFAYEHPIVVQFDVVMNQLLFSNSFVAFFHYFGETKFIIVISVILILSLWIRHHNYRGMLLVVLTVGVGNGLNQLLKTMIERPRPDIVDQLTTYSLPSGHAMVGLLYVFTVAYILSEVSVSHKTSIAIWSIAFILVLLMGLSRVAGNHHYASDVVAGWSLGFTWFMICVYWYESRKRKINKIMQKST